MAAAVVALKWAAQQETPILTVYDVEAGPDSVEIDPQVYEEHYTRRRLGNLAETREKV